MTELAEPLDLDLIEARAAHLYEYPAHAVDVEILAGTEVPALVAEVRRLRDHVTELETYALGCDGEGCTIPHSSWCERAKKTAAENDGCTCPQPWKDSPQPHAGYCWLVSPPRDEVEQARKRIAELEAQLAEMTRLRDNALRALHRDDVETDIDLEETIAAPFYGPGWDWDERDLQRVVREAADAVQPAFGKLTQQRDQARGLVTELKAQRERRRMRLVAAEADLLNMRGMLSPNGLPRRIPDEVEIHERVAPAVEWLLNRVTELEADLAKYAGHEPTIAEEMAYISNSLDAVLAVCHEAKRDGCLGVTPEAVEQAASGEWTAATPRPALPWAHVMDDGDLHGFLDDLVSAAMGRWRSDPDLSARAVLADVEKACADWRTPGHGYRSDEPGAGAGEGR